ncbi:MAG: hypothetical protein AAGL23_04915 [Pseudomonadota bacterium]
MTLDVKPGEHGVVRIFHLGYRVSMELQHFEAVDRLASALGVDSLKPEDVQIVDLSAVREMGLTTFLMEGYGVSGDEIAPHKDTLTALTGHIAILRSGAFGGTAVTLKPTDEARHIATLNEPRMSAPTAMPNYDSASGTAGDTPRKPVSDKAMSGRIAMYALLAIFAFTALIIWLAA